VSAERIHPVLRVPPPLLFVLTFLAGTGIQHLAPLAAGSLALLRAEHLAGAALLAAGVLLALTCLGMFLSARTTVIPHRTASRLLTHGPYRFTRNPMYLSLVLVYLGVAALTGLVWPLVLLPLPVLLVDRLVIPYEEARLRQAFGNACEEYFSRVRRWL